MTYRGTDPLGVVLAENLARRHLDESQRAMIAARRATLERGQKAAQVREKTEGRNAQICASPQSDSAERLNVSRRTVQHARAVLDHGTPELVRAVEQGKVAVSAAKAIAALPPKDQQQIALEDDERERRRLVRDAKDRQRRAPGPTESSARGS